MAEVVINYLLDRFAAYDVKYEELQHPYERTFSYLNNLIFQTELFKTGLFASLGKSSYQLHDAHTPFHKSLKEAKAQNETAFASFGAGASVHVPEGVLSGADNSREKGVSVGKPKSFSSGRWIPSDPFPSSLPAILYRETRFPGEDGGKSLSKENTKSIRRSSGAFLGRQINLSRPESEKLVQRISSSDFREWAYAVFVEVLKNTSLPSSHLKSAEIDHKRNMRVEEGLQVRREDLLLRELSSDGAEKRREGILLNGSPTSLSKSDLEIGESASLFGGKDSQGSRVEETHILEKDVPEAFSSGPQSLEPGRPKEASSSEATFWDTRELSALVRESLALEKFFLSLFLEWDEISAGSGTKGVESSSDCQMDANKKEMSENVTDMTDKDSASKEYKDLGSETVRFTSGESKSALVQENQIASDSNVKEVYAANAASFISKITKDPKDFYDLNFVGLSSPEKQALVSAIDWILEKEAYGVQSIEGVQILSKDAYQADLLSPEENWFGRLMDLYEGRPFQSASRDRKTFQNDPSDAMTSLWKESYGVSRDAVQSASRSEHQFMYGEEGQFLSKDLPTFGLEENVSAGKSSLSAGISELFSLRYQKLEVDIDVPFQDISFGRGMGAAWTESQQKNLSKLLAVGIQEGIITLQARGRKMNPVSLNGSFLDKREYVIALAKEMVAIDATVNGLNCEGLYIEVDQRGRSVFETKDTSVDAIFKTTGIHESDISLGRYSKETTEADLDTRFDGVVNDARDKEDGLRLGSPQKSTDVFQDGTRAAKVVSGTVEVPKPEDVGLEVKAEKSTTLTQASLSLKIEKNIFRHQSDVPLVKLYRILDEGGSLLLEQKDRATNYDRNSSRYLVDKRSIETHPELEKYVGLAKVLKDLRYTPKTEWVYNASDHDDLLNLTAGGVDELLLPQLDYDYSSYKEGLIDPDTLKPLKLVNTLADGSFLVERPISHPLPEYKGIAREYLDVNVSLLRHMILIYNKTWQENIFKFGAMDMRDSVAKMLEFMDAYIQLEIPPGLQQQAYRVLRLIRWYGEASILKNSRYRVSYIYEPLQGGFHTGESAIPCEKTNMHIDTSKYTLTNTVVTEESSVTFFIENPANTSIKMKAYQTGGAFEVFLNGEQQGAFQGSPLDLSFDLLKPGDGLKNELKLLYHGEGSGIINIANVVISDMVKADIITEYHPVVGSGNRVLDELIKKLAIYEDLYQNNESFFEDAVHGNLAITDLIQRLEDYFDLHHNKKSKGKRKTIRQT